MVRKLLKYDIKSTWRIVVPLWVVILVLSVLMGPQLHQQLYQYRFSIRILQATTASSLSLEGSAYDPILPLTSSLPLTAMLFTCILIATMVVSIVIIIRRFYMGLLRDEGYLMFTIPSKPWKLILSKFLIAYAITLIGVLVAICAVAVLLIAAGVLPDITISDFFQWGSPYASLPMWSLVLFLLTIAAELLHIYAAMAIGHLFHSHRVLMAIVAYFEVPIILRDVTCWLPFSTWEEEPILSSVYQLIKAALFFFITERILSKRLNLE